MVCARGNSSMRECGECFSPGVGGVRVQLSFAGSCRHAELARRVDEFGGVARVPGRSTDSDLRDVSDQNICEGIARELEGDVYRASAWAPPRATFVTELALRSESGPGRCGLRGVSQKDRKRLRENALLALRAAAGLRCAVERGQPCFREATVPLGGAPSPSSWTSFPRPTLFAFFGAVAAGRPTERNRRSAYPNASSIRGSTKLRGADRADQRMVGEDILLGGPQRAADSVRKVPSLGAVGAEVREALSEMSDRHPDMASAAREALGQGGASQWPSDEMVEWARRRLAQVVKADDGESVADGHLATIVRPGLLGAWRRAAGDPDDRPSWRCREGAPTGFWEASLPRSVLPAVLDDAEDPGGLATEEGFGNPADVEDDDEAAELVAEHEKKGCVVGFATQVIEEERLAKIRWGIAFNCRWGGLAAFSQGSERAILPRISTVAFDSFELSVQPGGLFFAAELRGRLFAILRAAQGSRGAPLLWAMVAALVCFLTQGALVLDVALLSCCVDDPIVALAGAPRERACCVALVVYCWLSLGFPLSFEKGLFGGSVAWAPSTFPRRSAQVADSWGPRARVEIRVKIKKAIAMDVLAASGDSLQSNDRICAAKCARVASLACVLTPFHWHLRAGRGVIERVFDSDASRGVGLQIDAGTDAGPLGPGAMLLVSGRVDEFIADPLTQLDVENFGLPIGANLAACEVALDAAETARGPDVCERALALLAAVGISLSLVMPLARLGGDVMRRCVAEAPLKCLAAEFRARVAAIEARAGDCRGLQRPAYALDEADHDNIVLIGLGRVACSWGHGVRLGLAEAARRSAPRAMGPGGTAPGESPRAAALAPRACRSGRPRPPRAQCWGPEGEEVATSAGQSSTSLASSASTERLVCSDASEANGQSGEFATVPCVKNTFLELVSRETAPSEAYRSQSCPAIFCRGTAQDWGRRDGRPAVPAAARVAGDPAAQAAAGRPLAYPALPSEHEARTCRPCVFFHAQRCANDLACSFCHLCDAGEIRGQTKTREARRDPEADQGEAGEAAEGQAGRARAVRPRQRAGRLSAGPGLLGGAGDSSEGWRASEKPRRPLRGPSPAQVPPSLAAEGLAQNGTAASRRVSRGPPARHAACRLPGGACICVASAAFDTRPPLALRAAGKAGGVQRSPCGLRARSGPPGQSVARQSSTGRCFGSPDPDVLWTSGGSPNYFQRLPASWFCLLLPTDGYTG
ncbi:unnamed protein product [Prorocentrum cordatum]|uniref:C3H1-type domain-containing protein n=1 Tax=Prorocentrum cordatum TaxID=2364126 RepID=A0ABN9PK19_9DINO|nr:unnamed protein product [Polarella glacialis]